MDSSSSLLWLATLVAYQLPHLIACAIGLALLSSTAQAGVARRRGFIGIGLLAACAGVQLALGLYQAWLTQHADAGLASLRVQLSVLSGLGLLLNCVAAVGLVLLVAGLSRALREVSAAAAAASPPALPTDVFPPA